MIKMKNIRNPEYATSKERQNSLHDIIIDGEDAEAVIKYASRFLKDAEDELFEALSKPHCSGITFSGGAPLHPFNREEVFRLIKKVRQELPQKTIWLYTGFLWEEIKDIPEIADIDIVCEGKFVQDLADTKIHWVGSSNQRVMDVKKSLETNSVVLHEA